MLKVDPLARRGVAAATLLMLGFLTAWTVVTPAFRAADEPTHFSSVSRLAHDLSWPGRYEAFMDPAVPEATRAVGFTDSAWANKPVLGRPDADQGPGAPTMAELRAQASGPRVDEVAAGHPPGYYAVLAPAYRAFNLDQATPNGGVLLLRLVSILLLVPIPYLCSVAATELGLSTRAVVAGAFLPTAWIQFLHVGAGLNNGALVTTAVGTVTALVIPVLTRGEVGARRAILIGLVTSVGLLAKGFALCLIPMTALAYLVAARRDRRAWSSLAMAMLATVPGLAFLIRSIRGAGGLQPSGTGESAGFDSHFVERAFLDLSGSLWANLGWLNTPLPTALHVSVTLATLLVLIVGTWRWRRRLALLAVLHGAWLGPLLMIVLWAYAFYRQNGFVDGMQGRYLTSAVVTFAVVAMAAIERWPLPLQLLPWGSALAATAGVIFGLRSFWEAADPRIMLTWWPHGELVFAASVLLVGAGLGLLVKTRPSSEEAHEALSPTAMQRRVDEQT